MKKKIVLLLAVLAVMGMTACGNEATEDTSASVGTEDTDVVVEATEEDKENSKEEADSNGLPNWKGVEENFMSVIIIDGAVYAEGVDIQFPSLVPTSGGFAYQMDPALVYVGYTDDDEETNNAKSIGTLEQAFKESEKEMVSRLEDYRGWDYSDYEFVIESSELMTINGFEACYYTGTHKYTLEGESREIPFVAYSVDTKQIEGMLIPVTILVMDDSIERPTVDPLPKGTIEAYAKKMVESIVLNNGLS